MSLLRSSICALLSPVFQQVSYGEARSLSFTASCGSRSAHRNLAAWPALAFAGAESTDNLVCLGPRFDGDQHGRRMHVPTDPLSTVGDAIDRSCLPLPLVSARDRDGARAQRAL